MNYSVGVGARQAHNNAMKTRTSRQPGCRHSLATVAVALLLAVAAPVAVRAETPGTLTILAAGTLAVPFKAIVAALEAQNPGLAIRAQFGGSVKMAKTITELHQPADLLAVADYTVIPKYFFGKNGGSPHADWYIGFARNAISFIYTGKSKYAHEVTGRNWYRYLTKSGIEIGRSNPDTDPSGYQTLQMLALAEAYYHQPDLAAKVLANAPPANIRDTETSLISALQLGDIDYLATYRSDAIQHHLKFLDLPDAINLSDPAHSAAYAKAVAHTRNGNLPGKPIVYAITMPSTVEHAAAAAKFIAFLLGPAGRAILAKDGFGTVARAYAVNLDKLPASLRSLAQPWPGS
jgi:molybdate/tungstate transport system substrate-binding protein